MITEDVFSKLDTCNTKVDETREGIKTAKKSLSDAKKELNAETGRLVNDLCSNKKWDFKALYNLLLSINMPSEELAKVINAYNRPRVTRTAPQESVLNESERKDDPNE